MVDTTYDAPCIQVVGTVAELTLVDGSLDADSN